MARSRTPYLPENPFTAAGINRVRQIAKRGAYDRESVYAILDRGFVAHVAFIDEGRPVVIPLVYGRSDDRLFLHGHRKSRAMTSCDGEPVSLCVTLVDGIVVGRSIFESSMNYRSVVLHGRAFPIEDTEARIEALRCVSEHMFPGRWDEVRAPYDKEIKGTGVYEVVIEAASAKVRAGPPIDDYDEFDPATWVGVVPVTTTIGRPIADTCVPCDAPVPASLSRIVKG